MLCNGASDIVSLARAAVNGDDKALDMFMWSKDAAKAVKFSCASYYKHEACTFYTASSDGKMQIFVTFTSSGKLYCG